MAVEDQPSTVAQLVLRAHEAGMTHARSIESNVVQDRIVSEALRIALEDVIPFLYILPPEPERKPWWRW